MPDGFRQIHRTKDGVWGRVVILHGELQYRILDAPEQETILDRDRPGVVEPQMPHYVKPLGKVRFYVEFYR